MNKVKLYLEVSFTIRRFKTLKQLSIKTIKHKSSFKSNWLLLVLCLLVASLNAFAQSEDQYEANLYLDDNQDNFFSVEIFPPKIGSKKAAYIFRPNGTSGFANIPIEEYIRNFKAYNKDGKEMSVSQFELSQFLIRPSQELHRITYEVWEPAETFQRDFHPHGLMIKKDELYLINFHLALGYMNNFIYKPYSINIHYQDKIEKREGMTYTQLENHTLFLGNLQESSFEVNDISYDLKVYCEDPSYNPSHLHKQIQGIVQDALNAIGHKRAQHQKFNIIIKDEEKKAGFGGSVHGDAYTFVLPATKNKQIFRQRLDHVLMHEVLHTLAPFQLHSHLTDLEYRTQFEYSKHLWLYEGITEYLALSTLLRSGRIDEKGFRKQLTKKYNRAKTYPPSSMTEVSLNRNKDRYAPMVDNVYYKGAVIGFVLDLEINRLSNGEWSLLRALKGLNDRYDNEKPFREEALIDELNNITGTDLYPFYRQFIVREQMIDINKFIPLIGWEFMKEKKYRDYTFGNFKLESDQEAHAFYFDQVSENTLHILDKDVLLGMDGKEINSTNYHRMISDLLNPPDEKVIAIQVMRNDKRIVLQGKPQLRSWSVKNTIQEMEESTTEQNDFRRLVLFGNQ